MTFYEVLAQVLELLQRIALRIPDGGGIYTDDGRPSVRYDPTTRLTPQQRSQHHAVSAVSIPE
jgi:hypothetical protein